MAEQSGDQVLRVMATRLDMPEPGEWVALGCPACDWQSTSSLVIDQPNGAWLAYKVLGDSWRGHWRKTHMPAPVNLVVAAPSASSQESTDG